MPSEPLHLCTNDHLPIFHPGRSCPFCSLRERLQAAQARADRLETELRAALREHATRKEAP